MSDIVKVIVVASENGTPIKDAAGIHGSDIGRVWSGVELSVDQALLHDGWVPITGPAGLGPTWKVTGKQGWIEKSHTRIADAEQYQYLLTTDAATGAVISCVRVG